MSPEDFEVLLKTKAREIEQYAMLKFSSTAGNIALRFIDGNFRAQGFQGSTFKKWKKSSDNGTTLVKSGALRAASYYTSQPGQATILNHMAYAKVHNEGFKGTVSVKAHTRHVHRGDVLRESYTNKKGKSATRTIKLQVKEQVKAHTREVDIPQRQFMPIHENDSPILNRAIEREVARDLQTLILR